MLSNTSNIRKAAVLIRSLDADTAASLLAQLSLEEAHAVRAALRALGPIDPEEQADITAEFRRAAPLAAEDAKDGVELQLTTAAAVRSAAPGGGEPGREGAQRFGFLEQAPIDALVPCLAREHVQTIAVVLSYLRPSRAAEVLAALPPRLQADTIERLAVLGQTDPDSLTVLERELAAWLASQQAGRSRQARRTDTVAAILAATQQSARQRILDNLKQHNGRLAEDVARLLPDSLPLRRLSAAAPPRPELTMGPARAVAKPPLRFDDLTRLSSAEWAAVLQQVDPHVLVLALAGSSDEMVEHVAGQMPRKVAKAFRRQLRRLGPTRLRDVEAAQAAVAAAAARALYVHRQRAATPAA